MTADPLFSLPRTTKPADWFERILPTLPLQLPKTTIDLAIVYHIHGPGGGAWTVRIRDGQFEVQSGIHGPWFVQISMTTAHLREFIAGAMRDRGATVLRRLGLPVAVPNLQRLPMDPKRAAALQALSGSIAVVLQDREIDDEYRFVFSFGPQPAVLKPSTTTLTVDLDDLVTLVAAKTPPLQLLMGGQLRVSGDAGLPVRAMQLLLGAT